MHDKQGIRLSSENAPFSVQFFPGFFPALQICHLDWTCSTIRNVCREVSATEFLAQLEVIIIIANLFNRIIYSEAILTLLPLCQLLTCRFYAMELIVLWMN